MLATRPRLWALFQRPSRCIPAFHLTRSFSQKQQEETVTLEYTKNDSESGSTKQPLLILHGLFGSKQNWRAIAKQLTRTLDRDTYCVDLRNHGDSPHKAPHTYTAMSADIVRFISDHRLQKPILIGHSMGGKVVMHTALSRPDLVSQLIVDDIAPAKLGLSHDFPSYIAKLREIERANISSQKEADRMLNEVEPDISIRQFLLTNMKKNREQNGAYRSRIPLDMLDDSLDGVMEWDVDENCRYDGPTLFIAGMKSPHIKPEMYPSIKRYFPKYELSELDTGHWVHAEMPQEFMALVVDFVNRNST
ncbi:hypothetical protein GGI15_000839 [Coemansia interrupta]|uniref:AB hydrolase-1 domain-containing protein n=1 Tax=Coemansia interrupta TaxID=1126814 RepID=A0A9W8HL67_9FUNG|nr:hypothetical protein GGI15_000839 [Coemansia interrupta]